MRVVIVGAGIGGLTAAIALRRSGIDAVVLERAPELREVGAGISLWPNAINAFRRLGVGEAVEAAGTPVGDTMIGDWRGRSLHRSSSELVEIRFGAPLVMIRRATLHSILRESLGEEFLRLGTPCLSFEQDADGVRLQLAAGVEQCDVAIGADGLHSVMRAGTVGDGAPHHSGIRAWRAVASVDGGLAAQVAAGEYWGHGSLFGVQSLGGGEFYWYAASAGSVSERGVETARTDLLRLFGSWADPVPALIAATDGPILCNDLYDRRVPESLAFGRVALVGDAAHPMVPSLGQGACQAIADGEAVAAALAQAPDPASGLRLYSDRRRQVAALAVSQSRRMSKVAHVRSPMMAALRNTLLKRTSQESSLTKLSPIIDGDRRLVAARSPQ